jgi:hypothetical protein
LKTHPPKEKASSRELAALATTLEGQTNTRAFLDRVDTIGPQLSDGKWNKLMNTTVRTMAAMKTAEEPANFLRV